MKKGIIILVIVIIALALLWHFWLRDKLKHNPNTVLPDAPAISGTYQTGNGSATTPAATGSKNTGYNNIKPNIKLDLSNYFGTNSTVNSNTINNSNNQLSFYGSNSGTQSTNYNNN